VSLSVFAQVTVQLSDSSTAGSGTLTDSLNFNEDLQFTNGTGALAAQVQYRGSRTMGGASENLDLAGSLVNAKGKTVTLTDVKGILFFASTANAGNVTLTFNTTNGFTTPVNGVVTLHPGAIFFLGSPAANAWAVTAGTGDTIAVGGASGYVYEVLIFGEGSEA
jgi:hypothetical protein